jgi:two-component system LytT family response regulator
MNEIRSIIVDDESLGINNLEQLLGRYAPEVRIIARSRNVDEAVHQINLHKPELVFLDISLPDGDGFTILENVRYKGFDVIFVTAYDEYALKAIEFSALHYLLKPVDPNLLKDAIKRFKNQNQSIKREDKINTLRENLDEPGKRIVLPMRDGFQLVDSKDILYLEADGNYCLFHFQDHDSILVSKPLSMYEKLFSGLSFFRVHASYLVNLAHINKYISGRGGLVLMKNGVKLSVSARRKQEFIEQLKVFTNYGQ